jgi:membrane protease YdiL (CAAX protease family)
MSRGSIAAALAMIAAVYLWMRYSMVLLKSPILAMLVYYLAICLGGGTILGRMEGVSRDAASRFRISGRHVLVTAGLAVFVTAGIWAVRLLFQPGIIDPEIIRGGISAIGMTRSHFWTPAAILIVLNPPCEEYFWRFRILAVMLGRMNRGVAISLVSLLFAGFHMLTVWYMFPALWLIGVLLFVYAGGLILSHLFLGTRSLAYPIALHVIINVNLMVLGFLYAPGG